MKEAYQWVLYPRFGDFPQTWELPVGHYSRVHSSVKAAVNAMHRRMQRSVVIWDRDRPVHADNAAMLRRLNPDKTYTPLTDKERLIAKEANPITLAMFTDEYLKERYETFLANYEKKYGKKHPRVGGPAPKLDFKKVEPVIDAMVKMSVQVPTRRMRDYLGSNVEKVTSVRQPYVFEIKGFTGTQDQLIGVITAMAPHSEVFVLAN